MMAAAPEISVIVPALDEEKALPETLAGLSAQVRPPSYEVLLADGGSRDGTAGVFEVWARGHVIGGAFSPGPRDAPPGPLDAPVFCRIVRCERRGRAAQMNEAARAARAEALLFLHADTVLPPSGLRAVAETLRDARVVGGGFGHRFRERGVILGLISLWATARARLTRVHYGDQAMFARREVFFRAGGFPDVPLFEDLRLAHTLRRLGRVRTVPLAVRTSARRLHGHGVLRTGLQFATLRLRHALGASPAALSRHYPDVR
jgi:rSAM/selenodomain-associated transferase 2